jgi:glycosyltransferase involved in cell wall biosynthesis
MIESVKMKRIIYITGGLGGETRELEIHLKILNIIYPNCLIDVVVLYHTFVEVKMNNVNINVLNTERNLNIFKKILNLFYWILKIYKFKKSKKYDLCISNADPSNIVNAVSSLIAYKNLKNTVLRISGNLSNINFYHQNVFYLSYFYKFFYGLIYKFLYNKVKVVTFISKTTQEDGIKFGISPKISKVLYNPFPIDTIKNMSEEELKEEICLFDFPVIISVGRLIKAKGHWYLLRIFKYLKTNFRKDVKLVIIGDGELRNYLIDLSNKLKLITFVWNRDKIDKNYDVYFLGFKKNPFKFISKSYIFAFPSLWEGFGNVLVESLICGVPIISADCKVGPREILAPNSEINKQTKDIDFSEYGVLMPVFDGKFKNYNDLLSESEKKWIEVLSRFIEDKNLRNYYSQRAKERSIDFSMEKSIENWKKVFKDV